MKAATFYANVHEKKKKMDAAVSEAVTETLSLLNLNLWTLIAN